MPAVVDFNLDVAKGEFIAFPGPSGCSRRTTLRKAIQAELKLLQRNLGITVVFVTHAQSEAPTMSDRIVVMNQGRIEQISGPAQLYTRPQTPFVAQFIGRNTVIDGSVSGTAGGLATLETRLGTLTGTPNRPAQQGRSAKIVIPPESLEIHPGTASREALERRYSGNVMLGAMERADVVSHLVRMSIDLEGCSLVLPEGHVEKYRRDAFRPPAPVWIAWQPGNATVMDA